MAGCCVVLKGGLLAWRNRDPADSPATLPRSGMPGWGIALVVIGVCVFLFLPFIAIVAAVAIPTYQGYVVRSEVAQGLDLTVRARSLIAEYIGQRGTLPDSNDVLGLPKPEAIHARYVSSVRVTGGKVVVTYGNEANMLIRGGHVVIAPMGNAAALHWQCSSPDIRARYLPSACRDRSDVVSAE
jgi:type IV pilus assembly protein PilA